jgi:hypothetical protein
VLAGLALSARVRAALKANESTRDVDVQVEADGGVVLHGIVLNAQEGPSRTRGQHGGRRRQGGQPAA